MTSTVIPHESLERIPDQAAEIADDETLTLVAAYLRLAKEAGEIDNISFCDGDPAYVVSEIFVDEIKALHSLPQQAGLWSMITDLVNGAVKATRIVLHKIIDRSASSGEPARLRA